MSELGLFEVLASEDENPRLASRQALLIAEARIDSMFSGFLRQAATVDEFDARFALVEDDFNGVVLAACDEVGHPHAANVALSLRDHYRPAIRTKTASVVESKRVKMCPYHSEVTDISLASGDPSAGFNAMSAHAWGDKHCQGSFEGNCNFKKEMVTQSYWDDRAKAREDRREQQADEPLVLDVPKAVEQEPDAADNVIDFPEPVGESSDSGSEAFSEGTGDTTEAPMAIAASTRQAGPGVEFVNGPTDPASLDPASTTDPQGVPTTAPPVSYADPGKIQQAIMALQQAAMSQGGGNHPRQQQIQNLLGQLQGQLYGGGTTASWTPQEIRVIQETGASTPDSRTAAPKGYNPASDVDNSDGGSKKIACPVCGGSTKEPSDDKTKCSRCNGAGKVNDWGASTLDALSKVADNGTGNTGLAGPEPKIDKRKWTPENVEKPAFKHVKEKDPLIAIVPKNDDPLEEIGDIEHQDADKSDGGPTEAPHTRVWPHGPAAEPVTSGWISEEAVRRALAQS